MFTSTINTQARAIQFQPMCKKSNENLLNSLVISKMDTKRLELGASKCFQMHIGKRSSKCHSLLVDKHVTMDKSSQQLYLGDLLSSSTKIDDNIKMRCDKGCVIKNNILSILKEVNLGPHQFEIPFMLHSSLFINGILYSLEASMKISENHVKQLVSCQKNLLVKIFDSPPTVPLEALFIDSCIVPIHLVLIGRHIMVFWCLLQKPRNELVRMVFDAMMEFPSKDDYIFLICRDQNFLDINYSDMYIELMTKSEFKRVLKQQINTKRREYLENLESQHKKTRNLVIKDNISEYLVSNKLSNSQKQLLWLLHCGMSKIKVNKLSSAKISSYKLSFD